MDIYFANKSIMVHKRKKLICISASYYELYRFLQVDFHTCIESYTVIFHLHCAVLLALIIA